MKEVLEKLEKDLAQAKEDYTFNYEKAVLEDRFRRENIAELNGIIIALNTAIFYITGVKKPKRRLHDACIEDINYRVGE